MTLVRPFLGTFHLLQQSLVAELFLVLSMCFPSPWPSLRVVICRIFYQQEKCLKKGTVQMWQLCSHRSDHSHYKDLTATPFCSSMSPGLSALSP